MFLNSSEFEENKQFVLGFDFDQLDRGNGDETESDSRPDSNISPTSLKVRRTEISPVPDRLAITPNRFYLWRVEDGDRWHIPIQLSLYEGWLLLDLVCRERDREAVYEIVKGFVGVAIAGDSL